MVQPVKTDLVEEPDLSRMAQPEEQASSKDDAFEERKEGESVQNELPAAEVASDLVPSYHPPAELFTTNLSQTSSSPSPPLESVQELPSVSQNTLETDARSPVISGAAGRPIESDWTEKIAQTSVEEHDNAESPSTSIQTATGDECKHPFPWLVVHIDC